jgi:hypothetical protein
MDGVTVTDLRLGVAGPAVLTPWLQVKYQQVTPPGLVPGMRPTDFVQKLSFGAVENCFDRFK